jgi:F-type H+-transporting ATPase subunit delta
VTPYAKALFEVAVAERRSEAIGQELASVVRVVEGHDDLGRVLTHPAVPPRAKRELVEHVADEAHVAPPLRRLLVLLAERDRLALLPELRDAYHQRLLQHLGIIEAHVTTAVPLPADRVSALAKGLEQATGKQVRLTTIVDSAIMGGVVARLGSHVFDGSVTRQLERLREQLVSETS